MRASWLTASVIAIAAATTVARADVPGRPIRPESRVWISGASNIRHFTCKARALSGTLETETDMAKRKAMFKRMLEICEREDPAYTVLHQTATFTAKRKDIAWKAAPAFQVDFRTGNFRWTRQG